MMMMPGLLLLIAIFVGASLLGSAANATRKEAKRKRDYDLEDYDVDLSPLFDEQPKRKGEYFLTDDGEFHE